MCNPGTTKITSQSVEDILGLVTQINELTCNRNFGHDLRLPIWYMFLSNVPVLGVFASHEIRWMFCNNYKMQF
jgi:hypothetical protein